MHCFNERSLSFLHSTPRPPTLVLMALNAPLYPDSWTQSTLNLSERPTILRNETIPGSISGDTDWEPADDTASILPEAENEMSEQQLRELYDSEEIDRFLNLFTAVSAPCNSSRQAS